MDKIKDWQNKAALIRKWLLIATTEAGSGHPTSCLSAADITTVLFDQFFTYDINNPQNPNNDRLIFSKGHAAPLLYTLFALSGAFPLEELKTLRKFTSNLEGHPTPRFPYTEVSTGSLGQGLSAGAGMAYGIRAEIRSRQRRDEIRNFPRVYVLLGDGEMAEGSVWEAANFASYYKLNNLIAIVDVNGLGQSQETMFKHKTREYARRLSSFGWQTVEIDGHNTKEINSAFSLAVKNTSSKPFAIIARTQKGKGVSLLEGKEGWHGKVLKKEDLEKAIKELGEIDDSLRFKLKSPQVGAEVAHENFLVHDAKKGKALSRISKPASVHRENFVVSSHLSYNIGEKIATREVYGSVLAQLGSDNPLIYALDGDVKNSTFSEDFKKVHPDRFIECFIAEQNMVGVALGLSRLGKIPFVSTFSAFLTRAFDQIRMAAISKGNVKFVGSHSGVSIGEDGSSQMGLEDIAMFGVIPDSVIFHPSDALSTSKILPLMASHKGISYLRTLRPKTQILYKSSEEFKIGGSKILRFAKNDILTIVACGITVHEALKAHEQLKKDGIMVRVIDCYSIKPIDKKTIEQCINETIKKIIITVEDHYEHGGLGDFVQSAVSSTGARVEKMAVSKTPMSGTKEELLDFENIDASHIVEKVKSLLQ